MLRTTTLIKANEAAFPDCAYYLPLVSKARRNARKHPDICIETCKSVLEGISKTIILAMDPETNKADIDKKDVDQIVKAAAKLLRENDDVVEDNFVTRATSLANALGALRNVRGDISHGKAAPKTEYSSEGFARLCLQMTDAIVVYMLDSYFRQGSSTSPDAPGDADAKGEDGSVLPYVSYEENTEFNDQLDQENPLPGKVLYSEALYRMYYEEYLLELQAFEEANEAAVFDIEGDQA